MKKLKQLLKESYVWERKFGEKLPTLADVQKKKLNEVGNAQVHKKYTMKIEDAAGYLESAVENYEKFLKKEGNKREAQELKGKYSVVNKFTHWMKTKWVRMLRKMI